MLSHIARRKRWWSTLRELDPDIRLSEAMRANLLVELSGLDRTEQLMIKTAARTHSVDEYAKVLAQHHSVVHMKERLLTSKDTFGPGKPWRRFPQQQQQDRYPKFGYLGYDPEGQDGQHPDDAVSREMATSTSTKATRPLRLEVCAKMIGSRPVPLARILLTE